MNINPEINKMARTAQILITSGILVLGFGSCFPLFSITVLKPLTVAPFALLVYLVSTPFRLCDVMCPILNAPDYFIII